MHTHLRRFSWVVVSSGLTTLRRSTEDSFWALGAQLRCKGTHLGPFECVNQTAFADVGEANEKLCAVLSSYALRRQSNARAVPDVRFVR